MTTEKPNAPAALNTSEGGRRFLADFFATELRRHDFAHYISTRLAADFACALAQHLAGHQPVVQEPVIVEAVATIKLDDDQEPYIDWVVEGGIHALPVGDLLISASGATITDDEGYGEVYAAPPAQGIDLGLQQDAARWRWVREQSGVTVSVEEADDDGDMAFVSGHTPEELDEAIDARRDEAPGVSQ